MRLERVEVRLHVLERDVVERHNMDLALG
jgi:hypothetical protein